MTREEQRGMIHSSHQLSEERCEVRSPAGTPRFYGVQQCNFCGYEVMEHPAGLFIDEELFLKCDGYE